MSDENWPGLDEAHESAGVRDARSLALAQLQLAVQAVQRYLSSVTPRSLWRDGAALVRREPALALGASFLLGAALARLAMQEGRRPLARRDRQEADGQQPEALPGSRSHQPTFDPVAINQAPNPAEPVHPAAGSPIGDSPGAGGLAS